MATDIRKIQSAIKTGSLKTPKTLKAVLDAQEEFTRVTQEANQCPDVYASQIATRIANGEPAEEVLSEISVAYQRDIAVRELADKARNRMDAKVALAYQEAIPELFAQAEPQIQSAADKLRNAAPKLPDPAQPSELGVPREGPRYSSASYAKKVLEYGAGQAFSDAGEAADTLLVFAPLVTLNGFQPPKGAQDFVTYGAWYALPDVPNLDHEGRSSEEREGITGAIRKAVRGKGREALIDVARGTFKGVKLDITNDHDVLADRAENARRAFASRKVLKGGANPWPERVNSSFSDLFAE